MVVYAIQLALNLAWTPVFFALYPVMGVAALWLGLVIILALIAAVGVTVLHFGPSAGPPARSCSPMSPGSCSLPA